MAASTTTHIGQLKTFIECSVCLDILNDPRILPCQHSFCLSCLQSTWAGKQPKETVCCPFCRETLVIPESGICGIRQDHRGNQIKDIYKLSSIDKADVCERHMDKLLEIFCKQCKASICLACLIKDHVGHSVSEVSDFIVEARSQMSTELEKVYKYENKLNEKEALLTEIDDKHIQAIEATELSINEEADELKELIEEQRKTLLAELNIVKQKQLKETKREREELKKHSADIASMKHLCNSISLTKNPTEISRFMVEFGAASARLSEFHQIQMERALPSTKVSFQTTTSDQLRRNLVGSLTTVTMRFIKTIDVRDTRGLTKLRDSIYVLRNLSNCGYTISVYEDKSLFRLLNEVQLDGICMAVDIASSEKCKCLYVTDSVYNCIWKITDDDLRATRWLSDIGDPFSLSVTSDDHILNLRDGKRHSQLEIYGSDASLIRILPLSTDIQWPHHVVQKPSGQFMIIHKANAGNVGPWVISQLATDGIIIKRYCLSSIGQYINHPWHLSLDLDQDRVFFASCSFNGVNILECSHHTWNKIRLTEEYCDCDECYINGRHLIMNYDTMKKQLLIGHGGLQIFELS